VEGEHHFGLASAGRSRLYVDGRLVVDNWEAWQPGGTYFGEGSQEVVRVVELPANQACTLTVEYSGQRSGGLHLRAVRLGVTHPLGDDAMARAVELARTADVALVCVGLNADWDTEGQDRTDIDLPGRQDELVERVAAANPRTIVVLQTGGPISMPWLEHVAGIIQAWYPGQECGNSIADVLFGTVNPSGKLPQSFPQRLEDNPAYINYPGENGRVRYGEGIFVGYRYYDKKQVAPLFPFGFGLSYTSFAYNNLRLSAERITAAERITVGVDVTNTGQRAGQEVVQLYVRDVAASVSRPPKELKGFAKVALAPGQTKTVTLTLDPRALAYWHEAEHAWVAEAGEFEVLLGSSSADIRARAKFSLVGMAILESAAKP
jgi:beta-glucosidase